MVLVVRHSYPALERLEDLHFFILQFCEYGATLSEEVTIHAKHIYAIFDHDHIDRLC